MTEPSFSFNDFRKWMSGQSGPRPLPRPQPDIIGRPVESKLSTGRLLAKMVCEEGEPEDVARDFRKNGGTVTAADADHNFTIQVGSGVLRLPRYFVRPA